MKGQCVALGDVFLVPVDGGFVPGKVLFVSKVFSGVILVALYKVRVSSASEFRGLPDRFSVLLYTGKDPISRGRWPWIKSCDLLDSERGLSRRIVAGDVWVEDDCVGVASEEDAACAPRMLVLGAKLLEKRASELLA